MPKMTDADWQTLGDQLAREVMSWCTWEELMPEERRAIKQLKVWRHYDGYWWQRGEGTPHLMCGILLWQPYENKGQALEVLDAVVAFGFDAEIRISRYSPKRQTWIFPAGCRSPCWLGTHVEYAKAINLAIEGWLDAQKGLSMPDGASG